jgi:hypothetical protein
VLLIVALGYGVVKPSLGDDMRKCQLLAAVHLVFGALYTGFTLYEQQQSKGFAILWLVIPLAVTLTAFYVWTLSALANTTQHLELRRQYFKLDMYKYLWRLLFFAGINLVAYFIVNTIWFSKRENVVFLAKWWRWRWFVLDGWLNVLFSVCLLTICVIWRPTSNNARYGLEELMSDPLADEFELDGPDYFDGERYGGVGETFKRNGKDVDDNEVVFALDSDDEADAVPRKSTSSNGFPVATGQVGGSARSRSRSPQGTSRGGSRVTSPKLA